MQYVMQPTTAEERQQTIPAPNQCASEPPLDRYAKVEALREYHISNGALLDMRSAPIWLSRCSCTWLKAKRVTCLSEKNDSEIRTSEQSMRTRANSCHSVRRGLYCIKEIKAGPFMSIHKELFIECHRSCFRPFVELIKGIWRMTCKSRDVESCGRKR